jgi:hypothetical protein
MHPSQIGTRIGRSAGDRDAGHDAPQIRSIVAAQLQTTTGARSWSSDRRHRHARRLASSISDRRYLRTRETTCFLHR